MLPTTLKCPHCHAALKCPLAASPGKKIRCPQCKAIFPIPDSEEGIEVTAGDAAESPSPPAAPHLDPPVELIEEDVAVRPRAGSSPGRPAVGPDDQKPRPLSRRRRPMTEMEEEEEDWPGRGSGPGKKTTNPLFVWSLVVSGILVLAGGGLALYFLVLKPAMDKAQTEKGSGDENLQGVWKPAQALLDELGPEESFPGCKIRPPKGYVREDKGVGPEKTHVWKGPRRKDGTEPNLTMTVLTLGQNHGSIDKVFRSELEKFRNNQAKTYANITPSSIEYGTINGLDFARCRLSARKVGKDRSLPGFAYFALTGANGVLYTSIDDNENGPSLKVHEASVQTFQSDWSSKPTPWKPDEALLAQLGPKTTVRGYGVRPPAGYAPAEKPLAAGSGGFLHTWTSQSRPDGAASVFVIAFIKPTAQTKAAREEQLLKSALDSLAKGYRDFSHSKIETGALLESGPKVRLLSARVYWTGVDRQTNKKLHSFLYVIKEDHFVIKLQGFEAEPHQADLKLAEAAALTFRKQ